MDESAWARWLQDQLNERGWSQAEFVRQSGGRIKADRISKWLAGKETASHKFVVLTANTLGKPHPEALRAAGFTEAAEDVERQSISSSSKSGSRGMTDGQLVEALSGVSDSAILRVLQLRAAKRESLSRRATGVAQGNYDNLFVGGFGDNVDPHEIDLSQGNVDLAASTDNTAVLDQQQPDYESESQDPEEER